MTTQPQHTPITLQDHERTPCERWTRVMGYHRPISAFNAGKQAEHAERLYFRADKVIFASGLKAPTPITQDQRRYRVGAA